MASGRDILKSALPGLALALTGFGVAAAGGLLFDSAAAVSIGATLTGGGLLGAAVGAISGALVRKESTPDLERDSPTYGFDQWRNPYKGDSTIPVVYSTTGHKMAPVYVQAFLTPNGDYEDDFAKALRADGQQMTALFAVSEGPIKSIGNPRANEEPLVEDFEETITARSGKKKYTLGKKRVQLETLQISVDGTLKGWSKVDAVWNYQHRGSTTVVTRSVEFDDPIAQDVDPTIEIDGTEIDTTSTTGLRPRVWLETPTKAWIHTQTAVTPGTRIRVTFSVLQMNGLEVTTKNGETTLEFDTAPTAGVEIVVTGKRRVMKGIRIEYRLGGEHQLPLVGVEAIRNTQGVNTEIGTSGNEVTFDTVDEVDDVILNIASESSFTVFDKEGDRSRSYAQFRIEYERADSSGTFAGDYTRLLDPAGSVSAKQSPVGVAKNSTEFEVRGDSLSKLYWSFSTRGLLEKYVEKFPNNSSGGQRLADFTRGRYRFRLTRTSSVKQDSNSLYYDGIVLQSWTEVVDEKLNYGGTSVMKLAALGSERINGSAPGVTCEPIGIRDCVKWNGSAWVVDEDAQGNPVWAAVDLITKRRYGGGEQYTLSDIDTTSFKAAADYCDATVNLPGGATEARSVFDGVLDVRRPLLESVADMLRPSGIWPVMQGNTWKCVIDQAVDLTAVTTVTEDGADRTIVSDTFEIGHDAQVNRPTEVQATFLDRERDFDQKQVWVTPGEPATSRRIQRITAFGETRRTAVTRYTNRVYTQATADGLQPRFKVRPSALNFEAGDVIRLVSTRLGIDDYFRVFRLAFGTEDYFVSVECIPYVRAVYGQQSATQTTDTSSGSLPDNSVGITGPTSTNAATPTTTRDRRRVRQMAIRSRRAS